MKRVQAPSGGNYYTFSVLVTGSLAIPFTGISEFKVYLNGDVCDAPGSFLTSEIVDAGLRILFSVRGEVNYRNYINLEYTEAECVVRRLKPVIRINGCEYAPTEFETTVAGALMTREKPRMRSRLLTQHD